MAIDSIRIQFGEISKSDGLLCQFLRDFGKTLLQKSVSAQALLAWTNLFCFADISQKA